MKTTRIVESAQVISVAVAVAVAVAVNVNVNDHVNDHVKVNVSVYVFVERLAAFGRRHLFERMMSSRAGLLEGSRQAAWSARFSFARSSQSRCRARSLESTTTRGGPR